MTENYDYDNNNSNHFIMWKYLYLMYIVKLPELYGKTRELGYKKFKDILIEIFLSNNEHMF